MLSSRRVKELGVRNSYLKLSHALHKSPLLDEIPLSRISLFAPDDDVIKKLKTLEKYRYEGALEIVRSDRKNGFRNFLVFFVPYKIAGGEAPAISLNGDAKLEEFLRREIGVDERALQLALNDLDARGSYTFEDLRLTTTKLRKVGLLPPLHSRRAYSKQ